MITSHRAFLQITFFISLILFSITNAHTQNLHPRKEKDNIAGVFFGATRTNNINVFTEGLEYHRVVAFPFGVAVVYEHSPHNYENRAESELFGLLVWNIPHNLIFGFGPGVRFTKEKPSVTLGRVKLGYILLLPSNIEFMPNINYDVNPRVPAEWVGGFSIGKQF
ncbi:MAG: hypothetical protein Q8R83_03545 [Legionellaceae bacterium]|nr:hypothetical protein [Legionellaceae bacterium]